MHRTFNWTRASDARNVLTRAYEPIQPYLLKALAERCGSTVFVDVGANIGAYSLLMTEVEAIDEIHAFEPSPETYGELVRNIDLNDLGRRIEPHRIAASDAAGVVRFGIVNKLSGANSIVGTSIHSNFAEQVEVEASRLDDCLSFESQSLCIKIDVEGHERQALAGMASLLARNAILLQIEDYSRDENELPALLAPFGLRGLCRVGPDRYFSSHDALTDRDLLKAFEEASRKLIEAGLAELRHLNSVEAPARIHVAGRTGIVLELSGAPARTARKMRNLLRGRP